MDQESDFLPNKCGRRVDGGVDRINQLPDEILVVILSFLRLREAAATSVLSSRWSYLWKHTPNLEFDKHILPPLYDHPDNVLWEAERCKCIETVNSVIRSHKALSLKKFRISLFVKKSDKCAVTKWLKFVLSRQVESLELDFTIPTEYSDVAVFEEWLRDESIICRAPETLVFFQSLKRLCLTWLKVSGEDIELFLRNCPLLKQLMIHGGFLTSDVELCGANLMLKHLEILEILCRTPKSIKVSAPNLTQIKFSDVSGTLSFENVPKLVEAYFKLTHSLFPVQHFASAASCYLSQLQSLELRICRPKVFWMSGFPKMPNLKKLEIVNLAIYHHSLLPLTALIWASPHLEEIKIKFMDVFKVTSAWMEDLTNVERSPHQHLKVFAFQMASWQYVGVGDRIVELVTYILDNCIALQKIVIGSSLDRVPADRITAEMQADADNLKQQLRAKVRNHIRLELPYSI